MKTPLGRHHPAIRRLRALRRDPALRRSESVFLAEGPHLAEEALAGRAGGVELAVVSPRLVEREAGLRLRAKIEAAGIECLETADAVLDALQDASAPQPVLLVVRRPDWPPESGLTATRSPPPLVVVLHGVQDPGNLGAILRSADAAGATAAFVCGDAADPFHPRAVRASMGAIFHLPVHAAEISELRATLGERSIAALAVDAAGSLDYSACDLRRPVALFFGREGSGLPPELLDDLTERVRVPMRPGVESLSVGAAAAVVLFEAARQRRGRGG